MPALSTTAAQNNLTAYLSDTAEAWLTATSKLAADWYSNPDTLYSLIEDGKVFDMNDKKKVNTDGIAKLLEKVSIVSRKWTTLPLDFSPPLNLQRIC